MRQRSQTIGVLGRSPARTTKDPADVTPAPTPQTPKDERGQVSRWIHGALFDNLGLKFLSIVLAVTVFLLVNTDRDSEYTRRVGVTYTLPDDKVLTSERLPAVQVTIRGPWRRLRLVDDQHPIQPLDLDLRHVPAGELVITPDMIHVPAGLTVASIQPSSVQVTFDNRVEKIVEIAPQVSGRVKHGYIANSIKVKPAVIKVRGAQGALATLTTIRTGEINIDGLEDGFDKEFPLVPPQGVELEGPSSAMVKVDVDEELVTRKMPGMQVTVVGDDAAKWTVEQPQVDVTLTGSLLAIEKAKDSLRPIVRVTKDDKSREGVVVLDGLPPGLGAKISPERVKLAPAPPAKP